MNSVFSILFDKHHNYLFEMTDSHPSAQIIYIQSTPNSEIRRRISFRQLVRENIYDTAIE